MLVVLVIRAEPVWLMGLHSVDYCRTCRARAAQADEGAAGARAARVLAARAPARGREGGRPLQPGVCSW